ncbi:hypothetical protein GCM10011519_27360 [Marmoricola endophyticus]|uniref:Methyltransferase FkbM domain-containing protein n=1 Tax=Marmoricola endophyticus TaxID=2040280 RepID=A0A917BPN6_9ACTN|nr:FkbM family methyltransferase [Marmoricola endophyticus]GGF51847.1 hypothetical protein GCM10011519_27360 [Marmoricola endophyticus]
MRPSDVARLRRGVLDPTRYRSVLELLRLSRRPLTTLRRYVDADAGEYPWTTTVRTPTGPLALRLPHPHDVRTLNEVFFRRDYGDAAPRVVVDVGANIGVASAYFLSRRPDAVVHCWEPVLANLSTLRHNLGPYADRAVVHESALAPAAGLAAFRVEAVGRYSGLADYYEHDLETETVEVTCEAVGPELEEVIARHGGIDLLKIDTEGSETALLAAVPDDLLPLIGTVAYERHGSVRRVAGAALLAQRRAG